MCNARKHPAGCQCGFGPPYPGFIAYDPPVKWEEAVVDDPWLVQSSLSQLDWDQHAIAVFTERYNEIVSSGLPRHDIVSRVKQLLGLRKIRVENVYDDTLNVPLFRFGAPKTRGAKITYQESYTSERDTTWRVKVFGIGTGDTRSMSIKNARTFVANEGECKVVYAPIPMKVERVSVYDRDRLVGAGFRAEVVPPKKSESAPFRQRGCRTLEAGDCDSAPHGPPMDEIRMDLEGDASGAIHEHNSSWKSSLDEDISVALSSKAELSAGVRIRHIREVAIKCELPSGRNYLGHLFPSRLWWSQ